MTHCDIPVTQFKGSQIIQNSRGPESGLSPWLSQFNWINWLGLSMFLIPVCVGYVMTHYWLLEHDLMLYYVSLYAQLGLLLMAWRQL